MKVYRIYDSLSRTFRKERYKTLSAARKAADKLDMLYGAYRYQAKELKVSLYP